MDAQLRPNPVCKNADAYCSGIDGVDPSLLVEVEEDGENMLMFDFDSVAAVDAFISKMVAGRDELVRLTATVAAKREAVT